MKVYVAASSHEIDRARAAMAIVRSIGGTVTFDWTESVEQLGGNPILLSQAFRSGLAFGDLIAIDSADVVWLLAPIGEPSRGACCEWGYALAKGKPTLITGPEDARRASIFFDLATVARDDDERAATALPELAQIGGGR